MQAWRFPLNKLQSLMKLGHGQYFVLYRQIYWLFSLYADD